MEKGCNMFILLFLVIDNTSSPFLNIISLMLLQYLLRKNQFLIYKVILLLIVVLPEGNGRSQREFIRCLALHNGYVINFVNVSKDEMLEASRESFLCEYGAMESLFRKCLRKQ